jgi:predicted alpha/beta-fold hydrolase
MQKMLLFFITVPTLIYAAYNPFFSEQKPPKPKIQESQPTAQQNSTPLKQTAKIGYFGFIESSKGKFALVNFEKKNIVITLNDSLYLDDQIFKVINITSNYILFNDRYNRPQSVYFSSESEDHKK